MAITSAAAASSGRHLLQNGVTVGFTVVTTTTSSPRASAATVTCTLAQAGVNPTVTLAALQAAGLTACTSVSVAVPTTGTDHRARGHHLAAGHHAVVAGAQQ